MSEVEPSFAEEVALSIFRDRDEWDVKDMAEGRIFHHRQRDVRVMAPELGVTFIEAGPKLTRGETEALKMACNGWDPTSDLSVAERRWRGLDE